MIELKELKVSPITKKEFAINWEFEPTIEKFSDYNFFLEVSEAPHDGFSQLAKIDPKTKIYVDRDVRIFKLWKKYYVRMRVSPKQGGASYVSKVATVEHPPSIEALELIRRTKITLRNKRYGNGVPCDVWLRKEGGQKCAECYDNVKKRSTKSNCENCYSTGYDGGFYNPIETFINFSVDGKVMGIMDIGNTTDSSNRAMMGNFPELKSGDVIVDNRLNRLWTVLSVQNVERRRHVVKQILTLKEEERTSILFSLLKRKK